ncbi:MAG: iron-sulfur cluster assembly accessory protein [Ectothiorhodospiraceae bacterium]|nr:iron-sulfur cluster assembly accessory protein [Chromatiales bacterium]MCP5154993.1 iron-sulfur cluster assembly accessory protein [Ectothiorhodospiraceae bacterium]
MAVTLTEAAADRVRRFLSHDRSALGMRLGVKRTGCSGFAYVVDLAEAIGDDDTVFETHGVRVVVAPDALALVDGTRIDYGSDGLNEGFQYENPNVKSLCGCGESFGV